jgi:hypothetical protein
MDDTTTNLRVKYILVRYNFEKTKLNVAQRLSLIDHWIASCAKLEEYEIAQVLHSLREAELKNLRSITRNKRKRTFSEALKLRIKILIRKWRT